MVMRQNTWRGLAPRSRPASSSVVSKRCSRAMKISMQ
jgi:hypothetical protein